MHFIWARNAASQQHSETVTTTAQQQKRVKRPSNSTLSMANSDDGKQKIKSESESESEYLLSQYMFTRKFVLVCRHTHTTVTQNHSILNTDKMFSAVYWV